MPTIENLRQCHRYQLITAAFRLVHRRDPDESNLQYWMQRLSAGLNAVELLRELRGQGTGTMPPASAPRPEPCPSPAATPPVASATALGAAATEIEGIAIDDLLGLSDEDFIEAIYERFLGRLADEQGKKHHLLAIQQGTARIDLAQGLAGSEEAKLNRLMNKSRYQSDPVLAESKILSAMAKFYLRRLRVQAEGY